MNYDAVRVAVYARIESALSAAYGSDVPVGYDNGKFTQPKNQVHARVYIWESNAYSASLGTTANHDRHTGMVICEIYGPAESGMKGINDLTTAFTKIFNKYSACLPDGEFLNCGVPKATGASGGSGTGKVAGYTMSLVTVPFRVDTSN